HAPRDLSYSACQVSALGAAPLQAGNAGINWELQVARFAAPAATISAFVETGRVIFAAEVRRIRALLARGHVIVCGDSLVADMLSRRLRASSRRVVEVRPPAGVDELPPAGPLRVSGDPRDPEVLRAAGVRHAVALYACAGDSATNTAT